MRTLIAALVLMAGCKPGGVGSADELCARAAAMYARCEPRDGMNAQQWELVIDRWRGLCRASITGEVRQLLPDGLALWNDMEPEVRAGLRVQAECTQAATTCEQYKACEN